METLETSTVHDIYKLKLYVSTIYILHLFNFKISIFYITNTKGGGLHFFFLKGGTQRKLGPQNPLKNMDLTDPPEYAWWRVNERGGFLTKTFFFKVWIPQTWIQLLQSFRCHLLPGRIGLNQDWTQENKIQIGLNQDRTEENKIQIGLDQDWTEENKIQIGLSQDWTQENKIQIGLDQDWTEENKIQIGFDQD